MSCIHFTLFQLLQVGAWSTFMRSSPTHHAQLVTHLFTMLQTLTHIQQQHQLLGRGTILLEDILQELKVKHQSQTFISSFKNNTVLIVGFLHVPLAHVQVPDHLYHVLIQLMVIAIILVPVLAVRQLTQNNKL